MHEHVLGFRNQKLQLFYFLSNTVKTTNPADLNQNKKQLAIFKYDEKVLHQKLKRSKKSGSLDGLLKIIKENPKQVHTPLDRPLNRFLKEYKAKQPPVLLAKSGSPIYALYNGEVVFANWLKGFGLLLIIDHGDGYMTLYGHNQALFKRQGDLVKAGDQIGLVGQSGGHADAGLYFEIRKNGNPITLSNQKREVVDKQELLEKVIQSSSLGLPNEYIRMLKDIDIDPNVRMEGVPTLDVEPFKSNLNLKLINQ